MKHFAKIIAIFMFFSCSSHSIDVNIDENAQVYDDYDSRKEYRGNNTLQYKIQYKAIDSGEDYLINPDLYFKTYDAGEIQNGKLTLRYPEIDETICENIRGTLVFTKDMTISNNDAKIKIIGVHDIEVYDTENEFMGVLRFGDQWCGGGSTVFFIYATQETKIKGKDGGDIYDLELHKGWNRVYNYLTKFLFWETLATTTNGKGFPLNKIWYLLKIAAPLANKTAYIL